MKFSCPRCKSRMEIQKTFNKRMHVFCGNCKIEDLLEFSRNHDEVFLEFLSRFDRGLVSEKGLAQGLKDEGILRGEDEIREMIGEDEPDGITREILFSKKDYISQFKILNGPEPEMGCKVGELGLDESVSGHLTGLKIERLYRFQEEAVREILSGGNVVIEAPTASGKTEAFLIPVIQRIREGSGTEGVFAIFVYPTKSLSRDQLPKIQEFAARIGAGVGVFDGDTGPADRDGIIENPPHILVTNFDTLHYHMLYRTRLSSLLRSARMLIVDEAHVYSGIFGSNVHHVIRRLKRMCGDGLQFVAASATLEDAEGFCRQLFGERIRGIRGTGKKGRTDFVMLFPSLRTQRALMVELTRKMTEKNHKTMVFSNSHLNSELLAIQARRRNVNIRVHRAGLVANYRGYVEKEFREGRLQAISCTPTLELGIDVGDVDCVISPAIPVNRLVQRIGRAARKGQRGFAFLALGNDPISQYYRNHPDDYFKDVEKTYIDPENPFVEEFHVLAMACDRPIAMHESEEHQETIKQHIARGNLRVLDGRIVPNFGKINQMLREYSIRGTGRSIDIFLGGEKVGDRALPNALEELHMDAIYFLAGTRYRVGELDYPRKRHAVLEKIPRDYPYYTKALSEEWPTIETVLERRVVCGMEVAFCKLHIRKRVYGYVNVELGQDVTSGERIPLDSPLEYDFVTKGIVFHAPRPLRTVGAAEDEDYAEASGYHAAEHVIIEGSNMITGGVSQDLGGISLGTSGLIFIYDGAIGGSGASKALYDRFEKALERSMSMVRECPCRTESGCPRCTFSYRCGNDNGFLHKHSASEVLERINNGEETRLTEPAEGDRPLV